MQMKPAFIFIPGELRHSAKSSPYCSGVSYSSSSSASSLFSASDLNVIAPPAFRWRPKLRSMLSMKLVPRSLYFVRVDTS